MGFTTAKPVERDDDPRLPTNLETPPPPDDSGFLIVRLKEGAIRGGHTDLRLAAREVGRDDIQTTLDRFRVAAKPLISAVSFERLNELETESWTERVAPQHSLSNYWRVDVRQFRDRMAEIEEALRGLPDVELVYRENSLSEPVYPDDDRYSSRQGYLGEEGVNATPVWRLSNGNGKGMHFIDLEQGWIEGHEDLPAMKIIYNDNRHGTYGYRGDHGTAVVGIVAAQDNGQGVIGITPKLESVSLVSWWHDKNGDDNVANVITAAMNASPRPHVLLIEAQTKSQQHPVELERAAFDAIRNAVNLGIIVVEAAGNGDRNLDALFSFGDSGAIMVGAGTAKPPHNRSIWPGRGGSNYGSRVNCYAWGDGVTSTGYNDLQQYGTTGYTSSFSGTSAAAAIIAGCALLLQGLHVAFTGNRLSPEQMRSLLSNRATGTAQGGGVTEHIGVMPNLARIVASRPDLFPNSPFIEFEINETSDLQAT